MSESTTAAHAADAGRPAAARSILVALVLMIAAIAALFTLDTMLARLDRSARRSEAAQLFEQGRALAAAGRSRQAVDRLRGALAIDRENRDYELALARILLASGRLPEADSTLTKVLRRDATDAEANLILARVLAREGRVAQAVSYYHRAIYGQWGQDTPGNRLRSRLELIDLLARTDAKQELLAELLPLEVSNISDTALRRRLAHLYVLAGSPGRGASIFRGLLQLSSRDADALAGLGDAAFTMGNYRASAAYFRRVVRLEPKNQEGMRRLQLATQVLALDPMQRGLGSAERRKRAAALLQLAVDVTDRCAGAEAPDSVRAAIDSGRVVLASPVPAARGDSAFEAQLDLAERLRDLRKPGCTSETAAERALDLVMTKMGN